MKIVNRKSNSTVKNLAQAGDAFFAFYFAKKYPFSFCELEVNTQKRPPIYDLNLHGKQELELWDGAVGFKKIPLLPTGFILDSIKAMEFTKDEVADYTHFILKDLIVLNDDKFPTPSKITTFHIDQSDRNEFITGF